MTSETPTLETVKADLQAKLEKAKTELAPLAAAVKSAERAMGDVAVAHAKNPNLAALVEASGVLTKANDALAGATAAAGRFENKLAAIEADARREADRATVAGLTKKGRDKCPDMHTIHSGLSVSGTIPVAELSPSKEELAVCERHDIHVVTVATVREEGKPPMLSVTFFGKAKRVSSGGGNGRGRRMFTDDGTVYTPEEYARAYASPESVAKTEAAIADPNKSASFTHLADTTMNKRIAEGHTVTKA